MVEEVLDFVRCHASDSAADCIGVVRMPEIADQGFVIDVQQGFDSLMVAIRLSQHVV